MNQAAFAFAEPAARIVATPAARASDPVTSHMAAADITASGLRGDQQARAIAAVRANPGLTSFELAMATDICRFQLARRLPEVLTAGAVRKGEIHPCGVTGKKATTWWPA